MPLAPRPSAAPGGTGAAATFLDRRRCVLVWSILAGAAAVAPVLAAVGVGAAGGPALKGPPALLVLAVLAAATLADAVMAYVVPGVMRRRLAAIPPSAVESAVGSQFVIASALGLSAALVASVAHFLTGEAAALALLALPAAVLLHWFPSEARWASRLPAPAPGAPPAHPLVRG
jgi:hypothetical protein